MVVAWSNHCCSEPCSWVPHRTHSVIDINTPFSWSSSSHMSSTFSSTASSNSCSGPSLRFSPPPSSPVTLYLPPHLSTYPPVNPPSTTRERSHLFTLQPYSEANRISEEVDSSQKCEPDDHSRVGGLAPPTTSSSYQRVNYATGVTGNPKVGVTSPLFHNSNAPSRGIGLSPSHKKVTYKGGVFIPEGGPTQSRGSAPNTTTESEELGAYWQLLDDDLKPTMPQPSCPHSQQIFDEHKELAHQLLVVQEEIVYLDKEKSRMLKKLEEQDREQHACRQRYSDKINQLKSKNESLRQDHSRLSHQLEEINTRRHRGQQPQQHQQERSASNQHYQQQTSSNPNSSHFSPHHIQNQTIHHYHEQQQQYPQRPPISHQYYYDNPLHPLYPHNMQNH